MRSSTGTFQSVLVLGGSSEIALATVTRLVSDGTRSVVLAARNPDQLEQTASELRAQGAAIETTPFDARDFRSHLPLIGDLFARHGDFDLVIVAFGVLGPSDPGSVTPEELLEVAETNYVGAISATQIAASLLQKQGHGTLVVLSSVAGERARRSNYLYGSTKAGLDAFTQGLCDSLHGSGVNVLTVRPGFVKTKMTAHLKPAPFSTTPERVAAAILAGLRKGSHTIWVPSVLRVVMSVLRHLPRSVFRRLPI